MWVSKRLHTSFSCSRRTVVVSTNGSSVMRDNISSVFGSKQVSWHISTGHVVETFIVAPQITVPASEILTMALWWTDVYYQNMMMNWPTSSDEQLLLLCLGIYMYIRSGQYDNITHILCMKNEDFNHLTWNGKVVKFLFCIRLTCLWLYKGSVGGNI